MIFGNCELNIKLEYVVSKKIRTPMEELKDPYPLPLSLSKHLIQI